MTLQVTFDDGTKVTLYGKAMRDFIATMQREGWTVVDKPFPRQEEKDEKK